MCIAQGLVGYIVTWSALILLQGEYLEAETLYRHGMAIMETTFGEGHPEYSIGLYGLAGLLLKQVKYKDVSYNELVCTSHTSPEVLTASSIRF